ncbi:MAG: zinc ABC transporter substrate-binding protein, partial [Mobilitalea sp.]
MKKIIVIVSLVCMTIFLISCGNNSNSTKEPESGNNKLQVYVSFNALYEFALAVGQDKVELKTIIPTGTEPHDFEPKAADIAGLSNANVFVYNGLGMESWAEEAVGAAQNDDLAVIIASEGANVIENTEEDEHEEEEEDDGHDHGQYDPHTWLSIKEAEVAVQNIADGFSAADEKNKDFYQANAASYIKQLEDIYNEYYNKFTELDNKYFVTGHAAFHYFCRDFGLEQNSVENIFAEGEPSPQQLAELVEFCKEKNIKTIFAEEMASPEVSETLANEVGAE